MCHLNLLYWILSPSPQASCVPGPPGRGGLTAGAGPHHPHPCTSVGRSTGSRPWGVWVSPAAAGWTECLRLQRAASRSRASTGAQALLPINDGHVGRTAAQRPPL